MTPIARWFRSALFATGVVNVLGAATFIPALPFARDLLGLPPSPPLYLSIIASWVFGFGVCYLWLAVTGRHEWLFVAIAAFGKLTFFVLLALGAIGGALPARAVLGGVWDLALGALFVAWLLEHRPRA